MKENLVSLKDKGENMATIANQGDISYLMPQLKTVMMFLFNNMVEQLNADENGHPESFSFELNPDNPNRDNIVVGTAEIVDWIRNQEKMVQQAKMIDALGDNLDVTFVDKSNPKSMDTITDSIQELVNEEEKDENK